MGLKPSNPSVTKRPDRTVFSAVPEAEARVPAGSQTLLRGLDVLEAVAEGSLNLAQLAEHLGLTRSTTHRLASALVDRRYLTFVPREGYSLGSKLLDLGYNARQQMDIPRLARPHLEILSAKTEDTVHLGVLDGWRVLYLDKITGSRRIVISSRIGELQPVTSTGLGKALILDDDEARWRELFLAESGKEASRIKLEAFLKTMRTYAIQGYAFDLEENEDRVRCVSAPIREADGRIVAALSVSSAAQYMSDARMETLASDVTKTAIDISRQLGWNS